MKLLAVAIVCVAGAAHADPLDEIGFGAAASAMANARAAMATGAEAVHSNPAGIARVARPELLAGWQLSHHRLELDGSDAGIADAHGTSLGLAVPVQVSEVQLAAGLAVYLPAGSLARTDLAPVGEPTFVRFERARERMVVEPVAALSLGHVAIGVGASLVLDARVDQVTLDIGEVGGEPQGRASVVGDVPLRAAALAGVWWRPARAVELAATVRGEQSRDLAIDLRENPHTSAVPGGAAIVSLRSASHFTPLRAALAVALHPRDDLSLTGEVAVERWSELGSGAPDLRVLVALADAPVRLSTTQPPADFRNIVTTRLGLEWQASALRLRAGGAYLPSPVPAQTGLTSFADGARTLVTLGMGLRVPPGRVLLQPIDVDFSIGWQHVRDDLVQKDMAMVPGGAFSSGGEIVQATISSTLRF